MIKGNRNAYELFFSPIDSTRYFEFEFANESVDDLNVQRYLDISSPRLFPIAYLARNENVRGVLINPDHKDLDITAQMCRDIGLHDRCTFHTYLIEELPFGQCSFDLISCISVLEHIPDDISALTKLWTMLKSGGRLILTVPCKAERAEQYINYDSYGILAPSRDGYTFFQRYYDTNTLNINIFEIIGQPVRKAIYGEKRSGIFAENANWKRKAGLRYPFWKEPYFMGRDYRIFQTVEDLPGEGVIAMEFRKH
jgi:SAM-dependent methyltransferase